MRPVYWTVAAALLLLAGVASAGVIAPSLQAEMDRSSPTTPISVIVHLTEQAPIARIDAELSGARASRLERNRTIVEALKGVSERSQGNLCRELDERMIRGEVLGYTRYWISNLVVVYATKEAIEKIVTRHDVDLIERNFKPTLMEPISSALPVIEDESTPGLRGIGITPGVRAVRAPEVWRQLGYTGAGRLVANLDTGVDGNHPALNTRWRGFGGAVPWQHAWLDVLGTNTTFPRDTHGHGTHVMGTECGAGHATGDTVGVAWGAKWIACNAINQGVGAEFDNDVITAYQWFANPDGNVNTIDDVPDVIQNSWRINEGFGYGYTDCDSRWWAVIDNCEAAGAVTTWSAGNEGPSGTTIGSPADRATTIYNTFSVGAVDATNYGWPYPIASFSSRGPTGCNVPADRKLKPEVVAPGVSVYSSVPGGGYSQSYSGTSMAGPHVAGIVGLIRQANPNVGVNDIKQILMDTARDLGAAGEDNTFGWGFTDAYNAVVMATVGFGQIEGTVTNASWQGVPLPGVTVKILGLGTQFVTNASGFYQGSAPAGTYLLEASRAGFQPETLQVTIISNQLVVQNFSLTDNAGPTITGVTQDLATSDTVGPYPIDATIVDYSTVASARLYYRFNGGGWFTVDMTANGDLYSASIPGRPAGTQIDYYVQATDGLGQTATAPANAPTAFYTLYITEMTYYYEAEVADAGWQLGATGDNATTGIWIRDDPVGTTWNNQPVQPEDDHTPAPGIRCFVTGNANPGDPAGTNDVDNGCTSLLSPIFDMSAATLAFVTYHRWWGQTGNAVDDQFEVDVSNNGGTTWTALERVPGNANFWLKKTFRVDTVVPLTNQIRFRFRACDLGSGGLVEAAIDDFWVEEFVPTAAGAESGILAVRPSLAQNEPNPFNPVTTIRFLLSNPDHARLEIYDASGRLVRTLVDGFLYAGAHHAAWDGTDEQNRPVESGVYFYRLKAGGFEQSRRMTILK